ncbi:MAG: Na/Pi cotransporter family protein [Phascolarctobacterium sp.]|nr:Na/Pi cotransporter family protein [Candidatus Phascolarctobacterium caballi]
MLIRVLGLLGGVALFMYGMQLMGDNLQRVAGAKLQKILEKLTGMLAMGVALGTMVTAVLQASGATIVMAMGLVNAGMLNLQQAFGVTMGACIGTTMTAQLVAFKLTDYIMGFVFIGYLVQVFAKRSRTHSLGMVVLGFGVLMTGMELMGMAMRPLAEEGWFTTLVTGMGSHPIYGLFFGLILTVLMQSSSASTGILIALALNGLIGLETAIPIMLGANIGSATPAVLASLSGTRIAQRLALANVLFKVIGVVIAMCLLPYFAQFIRWISPDGNIAREIANGHTIFNILNVWFFMPVTGPFLQLVEKILPEQGDIVPMKPVYLDENMIHTPGVAMSLATKEVLRMGYICRKNVVFALDSLNHFNKKKVKYVLAHEPIIDKLEMDITQYITKIAYTELSEDLADKHTDLLHAVNDLERIGDHAKTLAKRSYQIVDDGVVFSDEAKKELRTLAKMVVDVNSTALRALANDDANMAIQAVNKAQEVKEFQKVIRENHITRLNAQVCNPTNGAMLMELLINMKRVSDHSKNIAQLVRGVFEGA